MRLSSALLLLSAPLLSVAAMAEAPREEREEGAPVSSTEKSEPAGAEIPAKASEEVEKEAKEPKRICRRVKLDMSSRRATKVCKTADEWREFNQRR